MPKPQGKLRFCVFLYGFDIREECKKKGNTAADATLWFCGCNTLAALPTPENACLQNSMPTAEEDVNIACFHPEPGMGCVYGTKQGRVGLVRKAH